MSRILLGEIAIERKETCKGNKNGFPIVGLEHLTPEQVTLSDWDEDRSNTFTKLFYEGDILFGRRRAYLKKAVVAPFDGICSGDITVIKAIPERILPELLPFIIQNDSFFQYAVGKSAGSLSPRVKWEHLRNYEFELPNIEKQRELAKILWAMEETKKSYQKLLQLSEELVKSQFIEMFGNPAEINSLWEKRSISEICRIKSGTTFPSSVENEGGEIAYIKVADMNIPGNEKYIISSTKYVSTETAGNGVLPKNSIVFPKNGAAVATNKKRITIIPTCVDLNTMGVIPEIEIDIQYLYQWFQLLDLSSISIHFADDQLKVYSAIIADLIVRCSIEIEALAKDLYQQLGGDMSPIDITTGTPRELYFDTDCLDVLEQRWKLSKKQLKLTAINFYFSDIKNQVINPLHKANKRGTSGSKWKQAYQAIKHDRKNSLAKANICNLIHSMGALYILNLYYKDDRIDIGRVYLNDANFDCRAGSEIFSTSTVKATSLSMSKDMDDSNIQGFSESDLEKSIYIIKYDDKSFLEMHESHIKDLEITVQNFKNSKEIQTYFEKYPEKQFKSINQACIEIGGIGLLSRIVCTKHTMQSKTHRLEAKLNKHNNIYPKVSES